MKYRKTFVSNSSSTSFIVIASGEFNPELYLELPHTLVVDTQFGHSQFGWEFAEYYDFGSKLIFCYLQTEYVRTTNHTRIKPKPELAAQWLEMLESVVKEYTSVQDIHWNIHTDYMSSDSNLGYIDHASSYEEGQNTEMFESKEQLAQFLFHAESCIETGNDNEDPYDPGNLYDDDDYDDEDDDE